MLAQKNERNGNLFRFFCVSCSKFGGMFGDKVESGEGFASLFSKKTFAGKWQNGKIYQSLIASFWANVTLDDSQDVEAFRFFRVIGRVGINEGLFEKWLPFKMVIFNLFSTVLTKTNFPSKKLGIFPKK